jgi:hypothetical protein
MKHQVVFIVVGSLLTGCVGPDTKNQDLHAKAEPCLEDQKNLEIAVSCLKSRGYRNWKKGPRDGNEYIVHQACGLYWGWPFVASCSYIQIVYRGNEILDYEFSTNLDGL